MSPQTIDVDGKAVVVITVEPPNWGDPIHALRKHFSKADGTAAKDGEIFVRRPGATHPASSSELQMLQRRLLNRPAEGLEIIVQSTGDPIPRVNLTERAVQAWLAGERSRFIGLLPIDDARRVSPKPVEPSVSAEEHLTVGSVAKAAEGVQRGVSLARIHETLRQAHLPENRSADEYRSEIENYLALAGERLRLWALNGFEQAVDLPLSLWVVNSGERNLESVEITVSFSGPVLVWEESEVEMPAAPRAWGPRANPAFGSSIRPAGFDIRSILAARLPAPYISPGYTATTKESTVIEFRPFDLRPHKEYQLPEVPLVVGIGATGSIEGSWSATAKNRDGRGEGVLTVLLSESVVSIDELVAAQQES